MRYLVIINIPYNGTLFPINDLIGHTSGDTHDKDMTNMDQFVCGGHVYVRLKPDDEVITWGDSRYGGYTQGKDAIDIAQLVCGSYICGEPKNYGSVVIWGDSRYSGDTLGKLITGSIQVTCGYQICVAWYAPGKFVCQ